MRGFVVPCSPIYRRNTAARGSPTVLVAMDFEKRMRYRANGHTVLVADDGGAGGGSGAVQHVATRNNWLNCASFIPKLRMAFDVGYDPQPGSAGSAPAPPSPLPPPPPPPPPRSTTNAEARLTAAQQQMVRGAFCFYVATAQSARGPRVDINLRGGQPGFVRVVGEGTAVSWPDYPVRALMLETPLIQRSILRSLVRIGSCVLEPCRWRT